jgi:hypothetical protein
MSGFMRRPGSTDAAQAENSREEPSNHPASGPGRDIRLRELVKAFDLHDWAPSRLRAAVEVRRQDGAESPSSIVMLL